MKIISGRPLDFAQRRLAIGGSFLAMTIAAAIAASPGAAQAEGKDSCDPYQNYKCLDSYLGDGFWERLVNYYKLEWGKDGPPSDPDAPPSRRDYWPGTPESSPPMPFTEWPHGAVTPIGVTRPNSVDSPLMMAMANTHLGQFLSDHNFQVYGWVDPGVNVSSNTERPGGNSPIAYIYTPNTVQLDQAVLYLDRFPDTVQTDHIDWGMRISGIFGENYRYTYSYGLGGYQLNKNNSVNGWDLPMLYGELYIPYIAEGLMIRVGRYISIPDTEAQLAPNNYMYTHSITYSWDNYTNEGVVFSLAATKNILLQAGVNVGTEAVFTHLWQKETNQLPVITPQFAQANGISYTGVNPIYPVKRFKRDPGSMPSATACIRITSDSGDDTFYPCLDGINNGTWGYNNLQWYGFTYYHRFNEHWHITYEFYNDHQNHVLNQNNPTAMAIFNNGGTPFSPQYIPFNGPNLALCKSRTALTCRAQEFATVSYLNYSWDSLNNISIRPEWAYDPQGQRTGTAAHYVDFGVGWQHWLSPQIEFRPELVYYHSFGAKAFNTALFSGGHTVGGVPDNPTPQNYTVEASMDVILHF